MIIYGASGHGKVIASIMGGAVTLFFDDNQNMKEFLNFDVLPYDENVSSNERVVVAIGDNIIRKQVVEKVLHSFGNVRHPRVLIDKSVIVGEGSQLLQGAVIQVDTEIGKHTIVNTSASIDHDCKIGDFCHIAPNATLCGNVSIGEGSFVGAGATIIPGVKIGKWAIIGAGSVILKDVPDNAVVVGNPGRML
jgi:sugar O-acyltransferase (sialic acid O-acetyltransferase NeuD family)